MRWRGLTNEEQLHDMCDYGALQFRAGKTDCLELNIMKNEKDEIYRYMKEKYPDVKFYCTWPKGVI